MSSGFYFLYQKVGGEEHWALELAERREEVIRDTKPAFVSVLDLTTIPKDNDWTAVKYRGPLYFDFDADGDIPLVCEQFQAFLLKMAVDYKFDLGQAKLFASGGKGFHVEIPQECFIPKPPAAGVAWLPYVYKEMAHDLVVDTMDMRVYTGKRGRMWRTPDVLRDNDNYKVSITVEEAMEMDADRYAEIISKPRPRLVPTPAYCNSQLAMLFTTCRDKTTTHMRGKKKRQAAASEKLAPWIKAKKHPPTIEGLMSGELVAEGVGFQQISMQLAIYATSVDMDLEEFVELCDGLVNNHVSDSRRYDTPAKRKEELARMWRYMSENSLYDFDVGPIVKMVKRGTPMADLGVMETDTTHDTSKRKAAPKDSEEGEDDGEEEKPSPVPGEDIHRGVRRGFFMNNDGMWKKGMDGTESLCRASFANIEAFYDVEKRQFQGYAFDIVVNNQVRSREMLESDAFASGAMMKKFFAGHQISYQGGESETTALLDVMAEKSGNNGRVYVYPREGLFVIPNPVTKEAKPVVMYLTKDKALSSLDADDPDFFELRYRPIQAMSSYNIDLHQAPDLDASMVDTIHDLLSFNKPENVVNLVGWFIAAHYRSFYDNIFHQFPLLQIYGEAGAGKTQTVLALAHLHWHATPISVKSAMSCTNFAMDAHVSSSTSAPFILDEYKPREIAKIKGRLEKIKDVLKMSYVSGDVGERGTLNKGAQNHLSVVKSQAIAPMVFMGEAVESETAIVERCITVMMSKQYITRVRKEAFLRLQDNPHVLAALGRAIVLAGLSIDLDVMRDEVLEIRSQIEAGLPAMDDETQRRLAPRLIYNRAVIVHAMSILRRVLRKVFGDTFESVITEMVGTAGAAVGSDADRLIQVHGMSEISKVISRIALLSRDIDTPHEMKSGPGRDYIVGPGWVEVKVERAYDNYRRYCASIHDTPLFDNLEAFWHAVNSYSPTVDSICASSELRIDGSTERIVRLDQRKLTREGVQSFKV